MPQQLVALFISLAMYASAAPTYTLTVKVVPPQADAHIMVWNVKNQKKPVLDKKAPTATAKLAPGTYTVYVNTTEYSFDIPYEENFKKVVLNKNTIVTFKAAVKAKPEMDDEGFNAFNQHLINVVGIIVDCGGKVERPDELCAETDMSPDLVKRWATLNDSWTQEWS